MRFLAVLGSGTLQNSQLGASGAASRSPINAMSSLGAGSAASGRSSAADQKRATARGVVAVDGDGGKADAHGDVSWVSAASGQWISVRKRAGSSVSSKLTT